MTRKRSEALLKHDCILPKDNEKDVLKQIIDTGIFIGLRRKLCYLKMVNKNHPQTQLHFKSTASRKREGLKHLVNHMYMFHPFSLWSLYWEFFIFLVYLFIFHITLISITYLDDVTVLNKMRLAAFIVDTILTIDMIYLFFLGYFSSDRSRTILKPSEVAKHYLKTFFFVDLISTIPSYCLFLRWVRIINGEILNSIHAIIIVRIFRLHRFLEALELFRQYMNYSSYWFKAIKAVLVYIALIVLLYAVVLYTSPYTLTNTAAVAAEYEIKKLQYFYKATLLILVITLGDSDNSVLPTAKDMMVITLLLCSGYILQLFLYAEIMQVWKKFTSASNRKDNLLQQFKEYMMYKGLPLPIRERLFTYFRFKFQNEVYYNETKLKSIMSDTLKQEIWLHMTKAKLEKVKFLEGVPEKIILKIAAQLKQAIYLPDDVIVTAGLPGTCMYLIHYGTVAVYTNAGKELCHLEDGEYFGEIALVFNEPRMVTVVAVTPCELFRLKQKDFMNAIEPFPDLKSQIIDNARNRILGSRLESF